MGGIFQMMTMGGHLTEDEVRQEFNALQEELRYEEGHGGYTGTFAEATGLILTGKQFDDKSAAEEWLNKHAVKWGPALVVRVTDFDASYWVIGAWCSS